LIVLCGFLACHPGGAAAQDSPDVRQACTPDAMRLCSDVIPDVPKITACMTAKYSQLSDGCRLAMGRLHGGGRGRVRRVAEKHRSHSHGNRHCRHHCG